MTKMSSRNLCRKKNAQSAEGHLSKKILIVDDDPSILRLLTRVLTHDNLEIATASNGFEAGIKTVKFKPHLIVLDLIMPKMDGFEVCSKIKNDPDTSDIKIIAMSGFNTDTNKGKILTMGADAFFPKPLEIKNFSKEVDQLLGIKQITLEKT